MADKKTRSACSEYRYRGRAHNDTVRLCTSAACRLGRGPDSRSRGQRGHAHAVPLARPTRREVTGVLGAPRLCPKKRAERSKLRV